MVKSQTMIAKNLGLSVQSNIASVKPEPRPAHRILVVDDEADIRMINAGVLTHLGYQVDSVADGAAAWEALTAGGYDLLITDNQMPRVSGVELLRKLHSAHKAIPVIMATGILPGHEFVHEPWLQPVAVLLKPYTGTELGETVARVLLRMPIARELLKSAEGRDYAQRAPA